MQGPDWSSTYVITPDEDRWLDVVAGPGEAEVTRNSFGAVLDGGSAVVEDPLNRALADDRPQRRSRIKCVANYLRSRDRRAPQADLCDACALFRSPLTALKRTFVAPRRHREPMPPG
jgi:hypothetical protein